MKGKSPGQSELNLFEPVLRQVVQPDHPLTVLAESFPWGDVEKEFSSLYSDKGAPAKPVRLMAGLLILKQVFRGSDEGIVAEWARDPYFQYLCGENLFIDRSPCDPSDMGRFRKRIGQERLNRLLELAKELHGNAGIDKIRINEGARPGQDSFSYSLEEGFYQNFMKGFRHLAGKFSGVFSRR